MELCVTIKENATFAEALKEIMNGKGARRASWEEGRVLYMWEKEIQLATDEEDECGEYVTLTLDDLKSEDYSANDWEIGLI